ncbi:MAG: hypothetical protein WC515_01575 [Candidatus Omnitrophota bacterium]
MEDKKLLYVNVALAAGLIAIVVMVWKTTVFTEKGKALPKETAAPGERMKRPEIVPQAPYDISKVKEAGARPVKESPQSLDEVYKNFPEEDVGDNMIEGWARVNPQDKTKFMETLDREIMKSKETLKVDPNDDRAKGLLAVSEMLKKMAVSGFKCSAKDFPADKRQKVLNK